MVPEFVFFGGALGFYRVAWTADTIVIYGGEKNPFTLGRKCYNVFLEFSQSVFLYFQ